MRRITSSSPFRLQASTAAAPLSRNLSFLHETALNPAPSSLLKTLIYLILLKRKKIIPGLKERIFIENSLVKLVTKAGKPQHRNHQGCLVVFHLKKRKDYWSEHSHITRWETQLRENWWLVKSNTHQDNGYKDWKWDPWIFSSLRALLQTSSDNGFCP